MAKLRKTVIIAEDDPAAFQSLEKLLKSAGYRVMPYKNRESLKKTGSREGVPCVLILGDIGGVAFMKALKLSRWEIPIIFLHSGNSINEAVKAIQSGAEDYLTKPFRPKTLLASVKRAMLKAKVHATQPKANRDLMSRAATLTERECEIIHLVLSGMLNKQIAEHMGLAMVTVKVHRGSAMRKLAARTAAELARIARDIGIAPANHGWHSNGHAHLSRQSQIRVR